MWTGGRDSNGKRSGKSSSLPRYCTVRLKSHAHMGATWSFFGANHQFLAMAAERKARFAQTVASPQQSSPTVVLLDAFVSRNITKWRTVQAEVTGAIVLGWGVLKAWPARAQGPCSQTLVRRVLKACGSGSCSDHCDTTCYGRTCTYVYSPYRRRFLRQARLKNLVYIDVKAPKRDFFRICIFIFVTRSGLKSLFFFLMGCMFIQHVGHWSMTGVRRGVSPLNSD